MFCLGEPCHLLWSVSNGFNLNGKDSREPKRYGNPKVRSSFLVIFDNQSANMSSPRMFIALRLRSYFKDQELLTNVLTSDRLA